ncbi:hypothetical protein [Prevotella nigrescens]
MISEEKIVTAFWYQPFDRSEQDVIIMNGKRKEHGPIRSKVFGLLYKKSNEALNHKSPWYGYIGQYFFAKGFIIDNNEKESSFLYIAKKEENKKIFDYLMKMTNEFRRESLSFNESTKKYLENKRIAPKKWTVFSIALLIIIFIILLYICSNE